MLSVNKATGLKGKVVILRTDYNVPIKNGKILDAFRINDSFKTLNYLSQKGARVVILAHIGEDGSESLMPVYKYLNKKIKTTFIEIKNNLDFDKVKSDLRNAKNGEVFLLDNIRKFAGEKTNDKVFAKQLATLGDIYVNDAFSVCHRAHASVVGLPKLLPHYAGFALIKEVENIEKAINNPRHPVLSIIGGSKFSTKLPVIKSLLSISDLVFVGGALANSMLAERGFGIGKSLSEKDPSIKSLVKNKKIVLPLDVVANDNKNKNLDEVGKDDVISDIGSETVSAMSEIIFQAKTIIWNGPLGIYENGFDKGTKKLLKAVSDSRAYSLIGGGDTATIINSSKNKFKVSHVSTGGGATLEFITKKTLPGIKALG